ncbi:MAG: nucleotidyltransferase [Meiothermus sp.]|jgi:predicted nucleotidyltransferase|uniref:nucleotidyltransferase n=1 Tax=Meiothermus sp. TaxID=1955249 RepID=UPI0028CFC69C|nr:nucleotidyltransferase [Meiothermus sp.]MDT7919379.1 nucleotidyltransferase [Meiothermus sp.]
MALLTPDFKEFLRFLNENRVRYLLVGGYAVGLHGYPRYTKDLDIWVEASQENAERVIKAIEDFGFASLELTPQDFLEPGVFVQIGYPPVRIDLLTQPSGVVFAECYENREQIEVDGLTIPVIGLEDLRKNKKASGRSQDLADLEKLE